MIKTNSGIIHYIVYGPAQSAKMFNMFNAQFILTSEPDPFFSRHSLISRLLLIITIVLHLTTSVLPTRIVPLFT